MGDLNGIVTTHKGYEIRWSENEETWSCLAVGFSSVSLNKVRKRIDQLDRKARAAAAIPAYKLGQFHGGGRQTITEVVIVEATDQGRRGYGSEQHQVWWQEADGEGGKRPGRAKDGLSMFSPMTPEVEAAVAAYNAKAAEFEKVRKAMDDAYAAIPRLKPEDVQALMNAEIEEGA